MILINKGYNVNNNERFQTNSDVYSLYTAHKFIPNPAVYENICEDESAVRLQRIFFEMYPEVATVLKTYFEWSANMVDFYPIDPSNMTVVEDDGKEVGLTLFNCFHKYEIFIKPKDKLLETLYSTYNVPQELRVSWAYHKEIPAYGYKCLVQWVCNPLNIPEARMNLSEDEISFYTVFGKGLRG